MVSPELLESIDKRVQNGGYMPGREGELKSLRAQGVRLEGMKEKSGMAGVQKSHVVNALDAYFNCTLNMVPLGKRIIRTFYHYRQTHACLLPLCLLLPVGPLLVSLPMIRILSTPGSPPYPTS